MDQSTYQKRLKSNIWKLYAFTFIKWFILIIPVLVLFYRNEIGMSQGQVIITQVYFMIIVLLAEIPSGYFGDKFGRKNSLILAAILNFLAIFLYGFTQSFWHIIAVETLLALALVFKSGSDNALMYDSLLELGQEKEFQKIEGRIQASWSIAEGLASIIGGTIAVYFSLRAPLYFQAATVFLLIPLSLSLLEPKRHQFEDPHSNVENIMKAIKFVLVEKTALLWISLVSATIGAGGFFMVWFIQPYWELAQIPLEFFGILWALLQFNIAIWAVLSHKITKINFVYLFLVFIVSQSLAYIFLGNYFNIIGVIIIFIFGAIRGTMKPLVMDFVIKRSPSHMRATVISVYSMIGSLTFAIIGPFLGHASDLYSMQTAFQISAATFGVLSLICLVFFTRYCKKTEFVRPTSSN